jgi:hypothetical protein
MANLTSAYVKVEPSYVVPEAILQYNQVSGWTKLMAGGEPRVRLGDGDLFVYVKKFEIRTKSMASQGAVNQLPSVHVAASMMSTPTYLVRTRAEYDHHDTAAFGRWGASIVDAQKLGMRQGVNQQMRQAGLYGFNPAQGEGLINTVGATAVTLTADSNGHSTVQTYDNGQMAIFLLGQISALLSRTYQLGVPSKIVILLPQRLLANWEYQGIVQLTSFQRAGGGTAAVAHMVAAQAELSGCDIEFTCDDTLIGKGAGGLDAVIITIPEIKKPEGASYSTNEFAKLTPGNNDVNVMYMDMAAPREIPTPLPGGAIDIISELRITSGWNLRPEAITIVSMTY